jgi:4,5-dihydroxyphthalate decarboxylase
MHTVVIRQDVYEAHPWVAPNLLEAFLVSKQQCLAEMSYTLPLRYMLPWLHDELERLQDLMGVDYWPDGLEPNRHTLETFVRYSYEQGIVGDRGKCRGLIVKSAEGRGEVSRL